MHKDKYSNYLKTHIDTHIHKKATYQIKKVGRVPIVQIAIIVIWKET